MSFTVVTAIPVFLLGLVFGSFFNVAIYRWPKEDRREREWILTPSHCPRCGAKIRPYDNIPLLSYLVLGGKCRDCRAPIHWRYPAVELGTALLWLATAWAALHFGLAGVAPAEITAWHVVFAIVFASLFFLTVVIDFQTQIIPDEISVGLLAAAWLFYLVCQPATISPGWLSSLIGMFVLSAFFFLLAVFGGMGGGDAKLAVGLGALFGWQLVLVVGFLAVLMGGAVAITLLTVLKLRRRYRRGIPIPFGPYLAIAAFICLFAGQALLHWYLGFFGIAAGAAPAASALLP